MAMRVPAATTSTSVSPRSPLPRPPPESSPSHALRATSLVSSLPSFSVVLPPLSSPPTPQIGLVSHHPSLSLSLHFTASSMLQISKHRCFWNIPRGSADTALSRVNTCSGPSYCIAHSPGSSIHCVSAMQAADGAGGSSMPALLLHLLPSSSPAPFGVGRSSVLAGGGRRVLLSCLLAPQLLRRGGTLQGVGRQRLLFPDRRPVERQSAATLRTQLGV